MKYSELKIETQRQAPARARTEGAALLRRAGYVGREGEPTDLGRCMRARLEALSNGRAPAQFFAELGLQVIEAAQGEYFYPIGSGRQEVLQCNVCGYASPRELARFRTTEAASEAAQPVAKVETPDCNTIEALAQYLGVPKQKTAKALMYTRNSDGKFVFVVIRGDMQLSEAKLKRLIGEVRAAAQEEIRASGAEPGYASPIGLKNALVVVDDLIPKSANLVAGANEAGYHLKNTNYGRDYAADLVDDLVMAGPGDACPNCGNALTLVNAEPLANADGCIMENVVEMLANAYHDERGLALPAAAAPFDVYLLHLPGKELDTRTQAGKLEAAWDSAGIAVLFDDRDERAGVKFADADLIGCPVRATIGERGMKDGMVELKGRTQSETTLTPFADAAGIIQSLTKTPHDT